jgi:putative membrane protein
MYGSFGWIGMLVGLLFTLAVLIGFIWLVVWLIRRASRPSTSAMGSTSHGGMSAKEILQQRYAKGEITREQYKEMLADIE